jgi:hypothetical protein
LQDLHHNLIFVLLIDDGPIVFQVLLPSWVLDTIGLDVHKVFFDTRMQLRHLLHTGSSVSHHRGLIDGNMAVFVSIVAGMKIVEVPIVTHALSCHAHNVKDRGIEGHLSHVAFVFLFGTNLRCE